MADALWEPDGTQPPPAPQAWDDPVAGLVTGSVYESEPFSIELVEPVMPDMSEVRRAVDAVLSGEDEPVVQPKIPAPRRQRPLPTDTPGIVPPNPRAGWPRTPATRQLPGVRARQGEEPARPLPLRARAARRSQGFSAGIGAIIVLVLVVIVIIVTIINSLVETISKLFN